MEEELLNKRKKQQEEGDEEEGRVRWEVIKEEIKKVGWIATPMVAVVMSQYMLQVIATMMVGHLGELFLASTALAVSIAGVTGFSLMVFFFIFFLVVFLINCIHNSV